MNPRIDVRATLNQAPAEQCDVAELLASPWRHALGVWPVKGGGSTTHPLRWRWELVVNGARLFVTNDPGHVGARCLADHELACVLEAAEQAQIDARGLVEVLRRRGQGAITRASVYVTNGDKCGQHVTLGAVLKRLRVELVKAEVRT